MEKMQITESTTYDLLALRHRSDNLTVYDCMLCITQFPVKRRPGRSVNNSIRMSLLHTPYNLRNQRNRIHDSSLSTNSVTTSTGKIPQASTGSVLGNI